MTTRVDPIAGWCYAARDVDGAGKPRVHWKLRYNRTRIRNDKPLCVQAKINLRPIYRNDLNDTVEAAATLADPAAGKV
jgi:hypothetical protein